MTLNGAMAVSLRYFTEFGSFGSIKSQWLKLYPYCLPQKRSPKNLVFLIMCYIYYILRD